MSPSFNNLDNNRQGDALALCTHNSKQNNGTRMQISAFECQSEEMWCQNTRLNAHLEGCLMQTMRLLNFNVCWARRFCTESKRSHQIWRILSNPSFCQFEKLLSQSIWSSCLISGGKFGGSSNLHRSVKLSSYDEISCYQLFSKLEYSSAPEQLNDSRCLLNVRIIQFWPPHFLQINNNNEFKRITLTSFTVQVLKNQS